jgi:hypothetical protein
MPGATETEFFKRAEMMDTKIGTSEKDDAAEVARAGFDAMMKGEGDIVTGMKNKIESSIANVTPAGALAKQHRKNGGAGHGQVVSSGGATSAVTVFCRKKSSWAVAASVLVPA